MPWGQKTPGEPGQNCWPAARNRPRIKFPGDLADGMGTMTSPRKAVPAAMVVCLGLFVSACSTSSRVVDFARNEQLYVDVPFQTKAPGDRPVFVAPVADVRTAKDLPRQDRGFPITYGTDEVWERPVTEMVGEVLQRQFQNSGLFPAVVDAPTPDALVIKPILVSFLEGEAAAIAGTSAFAEVALKVQVFGPADASGKRAILHEETYGNRQASEPSLKPISAYRLVARALQVSVGKTLMGLDSSNCSRSQVPVAVPLDVAVPAK